MPDSAKKPSSDIEPSIKPDLHAIDGGGETTPERGNLSAVDSTASDLGEREKKGNVTNGPWPGSGVKEGESSPPEYTNKVEGKPVQVGFLKRLSGNRKLLVGGGATTIGVLVALAALSLLPLKLEMMIKNITQIASSVPGYATEQRLEYLITRAIAARMLGLANNVGEADTKLVFCKGGAVGCSLFATFSNDYFEKKLGIEINADGNGRVGLGGRATSWEVRPVIEKGSTVMNEDSVRMLTRTLTSNSEMKALIKSEVHSKTKSYQIITRYLARKLLMKKYGVTNWRGPKKVEAAVNRYSEAKANLKAGIIKNTIAKISPRMALYLTCLQGSTATCQKLREGIDANKSSTPSADNSDVKDVEEPDEDLKDSDPERYKEEKAAYDKAQASQEAVEKVGEGIANEASEDIAKEAAEDGVKSLISKRAIALAGGGVAIAGVADLIFSAVGAVDDGALDAISYDMVSQTYTGFSSYLKTVNDLMKTGETDLDTLGAAFDLLDGADSTPLYEAESGLPVDTSKGVVTKCSGPNGEENTQLQPGELVCDDQKLVRDYTKTLDSNPAWQTLATVAKGWNASVGVAFDIVNNIVGAVLEAVPGFNALMSGIGTLAQPFMDWIMGLMFDPPLVGYEATGPQNYAALSGGLRETENAVMQFGQDEDGSAMGGGGRVLSDEEVGAITKEQQQADQEDYNNQPMLAKLFDVNLAGSFSNRLLAKMPTSFGSILTLPVSSFSTLLAGTYSSAADTKTAAMNPFNLPIYGYTSSELQADPNIYTEAKCEKLKDAREKSLKLDKSVSSISVYTVSDPCALEKMVVGAALYDGGVYNDEYSLKRLNNVD